MFGEIDVSGAQRLRKIDGECARAAKDLCLQILDFASQGQYLPKELRVGDIAVTQAVRAVTRALGQKIMIHSSRMLVAVPKANRGTGAKYGGDGNRVAACENLSWIQEMPVFAGICRGKTLHELVGQDCRIEFGGILAHSFIPGRGGAT